MDTSETGEYTRRTLLRTGAGAATAGALAATSVGTASAQDEYGGYLANVDNFEGTADARGLDPVPLTVGAGSDGLLFGPTAAVLVEPGQTVEWEWTGVGGDHNVVEEIELDDVDEPTFDSRPTHEGNAIAEEGFTYEFTFEDEGVYKYVCTPHRTLEMKGVIVVGEDNVEGNLIEFDLDIEDGPGNAPIWGGAIAFGLVSFLGVAAYRALIDDES